LAAVSRFPDLSTAGNSIPASIYARLREHLARFPGDVIPFHIGDTHLPPPARLDEVQWAELAAGDLYAYGSPAGWGPLVDAIADKASRKNKIRVTPAGVQLTCGATHALACSVQALCDPGDELLLLTPHWPLIRGIALGQDVRPVEVPFTMRFPEPPGVATADHIAKLIEPAITSRTSAIYLACPNNPDGVVYSPAQLAAITEVAVRHGLWLLSDEVYEDYCYDAPHVSLATMPGAADRTVTVFSFAKSYAQAGLRVGYALAADHVIAVLRKLVNHTVYNVPVAMQRAAYGALTSGADFLTSARDNYKASRDRAHALLQAPSTRPAGASYLWVDFRAWCGDDCMPLLERIAAAGVLMAPGAPFGEMCGGFARLCFTGVDLARVEEGVDRINRVLAG
jgi:N-succinyldiaminopimelate aminotransferase